MKPRKRKKKRLTRRVPKAALKQRRKEDGRPKGTHKIYPFEQTRLGFLIKYEAPLVFEILMGLFNTYQRKFPPIDIIRTVCQASGDPTFRKPKYFRYLEEYERLGVCCHRPKLPTPERMVYYYQLRRKKMENYLEQKQALEKKIAELEGLE